MRIYTYSHGYSTTCRGSRQWTLGICASFFLLMLGIPSTSDAATLTYDFDVSGDDGASIDGWTDVFSRAPSFPSGTVWGSVTEDVRQAGLHAGQNTPAAVRTARTPITSCGHPNFS